MSAKNPELHPVATLFPMMRPAEMKTLIASIRQHGVMRPIWRHRDGRIIDGKCRWHACQKIGIECPSQTYTGQDGDELLRFVLSLNLYRQHLSADQQAAVAAELADWRPSGREVAVVEPVDSTEDLAGRIRVEHEAAQTAMRSAVAHAIEAGKLLAEAKARVGHGDWKGWIEVNCPFSTRTAQAYMRLAREVPKLDSAKAQRVADLSLRDALAALAGDARNVRALPEPKREDVLAAADDEGLSRPLKREVNQQRYQRLVAHDPPTPPAPAVSPSLSSEPPLSFLAEGIVRTCLTYVAHHPQTAPEDVLEALNEAYGHVQQHGLGPLP